MSRIRAPYINTFQTQSYEEIFRHNPTDIELFKAIGFSNVFSLDVSPYEGADFVWDLNYPVGNELAGRFDFIYDGGTIEHIFNFPQVLENLHKLLKPEGYIFHENPANNFVDHGFYQFSPSVFHDYYTANGYQIVSSLLCRVHKRKNKSYRAFNYTPVRFEHRSYGGWGRAVLSNVVVVKKLASSSTGLIPQQSRYLEIFWDKRVPITNRNSDGWKKRLATSFPKIRYWYVRLRRPTSEFFSQLRSFYPEKSDFKL
jgi:SAM-dependent methyltransferase